MESAIKQTEDDHRLNNLYSKSGLFTQPVFARSFMTSSLLISDALALIISAWAAVGIRASMRDIPSLDFLSLPGSFDPGVYLRLIPILILILIAYASRRLYPTIGLNRVDEIRLLTISTILVATLFATILFLSQQGMLYSRFVFALFWVLAILLVPIGRVVMRKFLVRLSLWGVPVGIVGSGPKATWMAAFLDAHPNLGYKPTIVFDRGDDLRLSGEKPAVVDIDLLRHSNSMLILERMDTLIVVQDETPPDILSALVSEVNGALPRIVMMPNLPQVGSLWVRSVDLGGVLALKIRNNLANPWQRFLKRALDLFLGVILTLAALPIMILIAAAIKLDSRGPLFYCQRRIGYDGQHFKCWKFRTMVCQADARLQAYLDVNQEMQQEWDASHKLKDDPRNTRVGKLLRKLSLDELPQLWNVLKREMSLVGPRPIVDAETYHYGDGLALYETVRPGITGLWQVSGRNDIGYSARVSLDSYYVRNWSVWLDLYILARTPIAVLSRDGAY